MKEKALAIVAIASLVVSGAGAYYAYRAFKSADSATQVAQSVQIEENLNSAWLHLGGDEAGTVLQTFSEDDRDLDNARHQVQLALIADPDSQRALLYQSLLDLARGKYSQAEAALQGLIKRQPDYAQAYTYLGLVYIGEERYQEAREALSSANALAPNDLAIRVNYGRMLTVVRELDDAKKILSDPDSEHRNHPAVLNELGNAYAKGGDFQTAARKYQSGIDNSPSSQLEPILYRNLGSARYFDNLPKEAERALRKAIELNPRDAVAWAILFEVESEQGDEKGMREAAERSQELREFFLQPN